MPAPEPMLSALASRWPAGNDWILQPKWDGFRVLIEVSARGTARAWSRHGTSLTGRLETILEPIAELPRGTVIDGELVAIADRDGRPVQDFATVQRAVLRGDADAAARLRFVAFDALSIGGTDLRSRPWRERDEQLRGRLPVCDVIRLVESQPADEAAHQAIVALGFEGTVLKRPRSTYRPGRQATWRKHKAQHVTRGLVLDVRQDRESRYWAICDVEGQRIAAATGSRNADSKGRRVTIVYSRVDADGDLREARATTPD